MLFLRGSVLAISFFFCILCLLLSCKLLVMSLLASVLLGSTESAVELLSKEILDVIAAILRTVTSNLDIECVFTFFHHLINTICCIASVWKIVRRELV